MTSRFVFGRNALAVSALAACSGGPGSYKASPYRDGVSSSFEAPGPSNEATGTKADMPPGSRDPARSSADTVGKIDCPPCGAYRCTLGDQSETVITLEPVEGGGCTIKGEVEREDVDLRCGGEIVTGRGRGAWSVADDGSLLLTEGKGKARCTSTKG